MQGPGDSQGSPESSEGRGPLGPAADDYRLPITELELELCVVWGAVSGAADADGEERECAEGRGGGVGQGGVSVCRCVVAKASWRRQKPE